MARFVDAQKTTRRPRRRVTVQTTTTSTPAMTTTENGMPTHVSSDSNVLDLYYQMGAIRAKAVQDDLAEFATTFLAALREDVTLTLKAMFYNRDVREGQGERTAFRFMFRLLCTKAPNLAIVNIPNVVHFGRWDDLFTAMDTPVEAAALAYMAAHLEQDETNSLCAKWMPREGTAWGAFGNRLRQAMGLDWREYRQLLAGKTDVVETLMCQGRWNEIDYNKVPSQAIMKYRKAWYRHDQARYEAWVQALKAGVPGVKINAKAIHPHEIIAPMMNLHYGYGTRPVEFDMLEAQWNALPNWMDANRKILPVVDVSGSMEGLPMQVAIALGLYISERNVGPFHNAFFTFAEHPSFIHLDASMSLFDRVQDVKAADWGGNTNLEAVFKVLLKNANTENVPAHEMPSTILVLSDMQFDASRDSATDSALDMIDREYERYGYKRPNIVFWNLRDSNGVPAQADQRGTMLVSGFSPSIMRAILACTDIPAPPTPYETMLETLNSERYERVITDVAEKVKPPRRKPTTKKKASPRGKQTR